MEFDICAVIGNNVRLLRERNNISKRVFAEMCGLSRVYLDRVESGTANPTVRVLERIASALACDVTDLLDPGLEACVRDRRTVLGNL